MTTNLYYPPQRESHLRQEYLKLICFRMNHYFVIL